MTSRDLTGVQEGPRGAPKGAEDERGRAHCVHYEGHAMLVRGAVKCRAGVEYKSVGATLKDRPCYNGHRFEVSPCAKWERPTVEAAKAANEAMEAAFKRAMAGMEVAAKWRVKPKPKEDRIGEVECPCCKGKLHLSQSSYNGHVWGKCETDGCVSWME